MQTSYLPRIASWSRPFQQIPNLAQILMCFISPSVKQKWKIRFLFLLLLRELMIQIIKYLRYMPHIHHVNTNSFVELHELSTMPHFLVTPVLSAPVNCSPGCKAELLEGLSKQAQTVDCIGLRQKARISMLRKGFSSVYPYPNFRYTRNFKDRQRE